MAIYPVTTTSDASQITTNSAVLNGTVNDNGNITTVTMEYGTAADLSGSTVITPDNGVSPVTAGKGTVVFSNTLRGLTPATTYYFRINGTNVNGVNHGSIYSFTTLAGVPTINSFSPVAGPVGTMITINGTNLNNFTSLTIGGKNGIVLSNTGSALTLMVMPGTITGAISIVNPSGIATGGSNFTVTDTPYPYSQQGNKLTGTGEAVNPNTSNGSEQGGFLALSADGNTLASGGGYDYPNGAIWIFTRSNGTWVQQAKVVNNSGGPNFTCTLSADGNTLLAGNIVYVRTGTTWTQQSILTSAGAYGLSAGVGGTGLSADGNTVALCAYSADAFGAVWVFKRHGST